ncbi:MAG: ABC transporter ATP-binding protein [Hyphomicrobiales bacterium]|nr:MAG: ABC transporter ATP-binding protein [Hyphomicrobiales bacterium]
MSAIRLTDLTLGYDRHPAVHHLSGEIETGSLTAIVGPNGAGKSTLLKGIAGALAPLSGGVALAKGKRLAYLPQSADLDRSFPIHVYDLVAMGLWNRAGIFGRIGAGVADKIAHAIAAVGPIGTLSGGQMQRALFARLLLQDADVILLDEPFTAIDARTTADLLELVRRWHGESRTVVAVLHDIETVRQAFPQTLLLAREAVAWGETATVLTPENLLRARRMVESFDSHAAPCQRDAA